MGKLLKYIKTHFLEDQLIRKQSSLGGSHEDQLNELENQISALKRVREEIFFLMMLGKGQVGISDRYSLRKNQPFGKEMPELYPK